MDFRAMRYFLAVAEELHFGRAARRLHISQPPLSQQIRKLEDELGVRLFERTQRRVALTPAGEVFLGKAQSLLLGAEEAKRAAQRASRGEIGRLVVGFIHAAFYNLLPAIVRRFRDTQPAVELVLREMTNREQLAALGDGKLDFGFLRPPVVDPLIQVDVLLREPFVVALPEDHPLAARHRVELKSLAAEPLVMYPPRRSPLYGQIVDGCVRSGFSPRVVQEAAYINTLIGLVRARIGLALLPACAREVSMPGIVYRALTGLAAQAETAVAWRREDHSPIVAAFLECARARPRTVRQTDPNR